MGSSRSWLRLLLPGVLATAGTVQAAAQVGSLSPTQVISLAATRPTQLTLSILSGSTQTLPGLTDNAANSFPTPVVLQTSWDLNPGQTGSVRIVGWFSNPAQALFSPTGGPIPSLRMKGRVTGTGAVPLAFTAFTQNPIGGVGSAGGSLQLVNVTIAGPNKQATQTNNLDLQLDLTGAPVLLPGTYSGTLNIRAVTQ
ncbi:MAG TPA: hypothetical protein VFU46_05885 [Gemmatimonadales bacterium]|nr:hypothetical protein [Gemmatimonadales bacterium]